MNAIHDSIDIPLAASADDRLVKQAIWQNMFDHYLAFGTIPGGTSYDSPDIKWAYVGKPLLFNRIFGVRFAPEEAAARVAQATELVACWGSRVSWLIDPESTPPDLASILLNNGWRNPRGEGQPLLTWPGMALALSTLAVEIAIPPGLTISRAADDAALRAWVTGFFSQASQPMFEDILAVYNELGYSEHSPWSYYTAYLDGEPVAASMLHCAAGVAGVYWVGVIPAVRRQGIGTAITWHALRQAQQMGYHWAVLQATELGAPVYRRLGFKEYGAVTCFVYKP